MSSEPLCPSTATQTPPSGEARSLRPESCLLLTQDPELASAASQVLEWHHVSAVTCPDPAESERIFRDLQPGLLLVDCPNAEPSISGLLRANAQTQRQAAIIVVAGPDHREQARAALDAGAYDVVEKPIDRRLLSAAIRRALQYRELLRSSNEHLRRLEETVEQTLSVVRQKEFLQGILDSSTLVSVVMTDMEQNVLFWNTGASNIFGYTEEEMLGQKITRLYPPDALTADQVRSLQEMVWSKTGTVHGKMKQLTKGGQERTISLAISPVVGALGELEGILGIGLDATEEVRLFDLVKRTQDATIFALAKLAEHRDEETGNHLLRIQEYCRLLCHRLATREKYAELMTPEYIEDLARSSILHDIGKVGIPDRVLLCEERFKPEMRTIMQKHPRIGGDYLAEAVARLGEDSFVTMARDIAYYHHEKWDGSGYPFSLAGEQIPLPARIVAVADVYDALTSRRRYKDPYSHEKAMGIIVDGRGRHFDPGLIDELLEMHDEFRRIRTTFP
jgi:PAS domain S-box-containing protein